MVRVFMIGFRHAFKGNSKHAKAAAPICDIYVFVNDNNAKIHIVIETMKLLSTIKPSLTRAFLELEVPEARRASRFTSFIIIALYAQLVQRKTRMLTAT